MPQAYEEHYTVEDYRQWEGDWELVHGMPYAMTPSPSVSHQACVTNLAHLFKAASEKEKDCSKCLVLVEIDWEVAIDTVVRPDLLVTCQPGGERITRTPELVAEVVSATSAKRDENLKFELYAQEGVGWYLLVYPEQRLAKVYRNRDGEFSRFADASDEEITIEALPLIEWVV